MIVNPVVDRGSKSVFNPFPEREYLGCVEEYRSFLSSSDIVIDVPEEWFEEAGTDINSSVVKRKFLICASREGGINVLPVFGGASFIKGNSRSVICRLAGIDTNSNSGFVEGGTLLNMGYFNLDGDNFRITYKRNEELGTYTGAIQFCAIHVWK